MGNTVEKVMRDVVEINEDDVDVVSGGADVTDDCLDSGGSLEGE